MIKNVDEGKVYIGFGFYIKIYFRLAVSTRAMYFFRLAVLLKKHRIATDGQLVVSAQIQGLTAYEYAQFLGVTFSRPQLAIDAHRAFSIVWHSSRTRK